MLLIESIGVDLKMSIDDLIYEIQKTQEEVQDLKQKKSIKRNRSLLHFISKNKVKRIKIPQEKNCG